MWSSPNPPLPPICNTLWVMFFLYQSKVKNWIGDEMDCSFFFFFISLREDAALKNCNYSCKSRRRMWAARSRLIRNRSHLTLRASPNSSVGGGGVSGVRDNSVNMILQCRPRSHVLTAGSLWSSPLLSLNLSHPLIHSPSLLTLTPVTPSQRFPLWDGAGR